MIKRTKFKTISAYLLAATHTISEEEALRLDTMAISQDLSMSKLGWLLIDHYYSRHYEKDNTTEAS